MNLGTIKFLQPLKNKRFSLLFSGQLLSDCGNWLDYIAIYTLLVYTWQLGPDAVAAQVIAAGVPWIFLGPLISVWVDRLPTKVTLVVSDILRAIIVFCLFFTTSLWLLLMLVFLKNSVATAFEPARMKTIKSVIPHQELSQAISLSQTSVYLMKIIAPIVGGVIAAQTSSSFIFLIEGVLFLISSVLLSFIPNDLNQTQSVDKPKFWKELTGGIKHLKTTSTLLMAVILVSVSLFLIFLFEGLFVLWAKEQNLSEQAYGMLISAIGLGSLVGVLGGGSWEGWKKSPLSSISSAVFISGILVTILGIGGMLSFQLPTLVWSAMAFCAGVCAAFTTVPFGYILQTETPSHLIGRVTGSSNALQNVSTFLAPLLGASLAAAFSTNFVFLGAGVGLVLLGGISTMTVLANKSRDSSNIEQKQENY